ncbi:ATP-binding protein [Mesorhizobium sp. B2-6-4]|uniref:ATP-binding protein n=1 Tax=Mesorhizobium sp. B2-6-4 TaxID=2589913 RepID=UPI0015E4362A|nr:ATP-binding protein [Mesorhizobium sp. B2-6-4]
MLDANQLDVAILNLTVKARHAMADSGTFTIEASDAPDDQDDLKGPAASFVRLTLSDTGHGWTNKFSPRSSGPSSPPKANCEETGLGLSQVYGFVSQSGGHVRIDSEVGKQTRVHLSCREQLQSEQAVSDHGDARRPRFSRIAL